MKRICPIKKVIWISSIKNWFDKKTKLICSRKSDKTAILVKCRAKRKKSPKLLTN